jgi:DNA-binding transcriptional LysR family regulator
MVKNMRKIDLNLLPYLDVLLDEASITKAARKLNITQAALSNALLRLRETFDDQLLVRSGRRMVATPLAKKIHLPLKQSLGHIHNEILQERTFNPQHDIFQFNTAFHGHEEALLMPKLWQSMRNYPGLIITNRVPNHHVIAEELALGEVHFTTATIPQTSADIMCKLIFSETIVCVAHHQFTHASLTKEEYFRQNHLLITPGGGQSLIDTLLKDKALRMSRITVSEFGNAPFLLSQNHHLISSVPKRLAIMWQANFPLKIVPFPIAIPPISIFLRWHKNAEHNPALRWFKDLLFKAVHDENGNSPRHPTEQSPSLF